MFTLKLQPSVCKLEAVVFFYPLDNLPILWYIGYVMTSKEHPQNLFSKLLGAMLLIVLITGALFYIYINIYPDTFGESANPCDPGSSWDGDNCIPDERDLYRPYR